MSSPRDGLDEDLEERLERLWWTAVGRSVDDGDRPLQDTSPAPLKFRVFAPVYRLFGWEPEIRRQALSEFRHSVRDGNLSAEAIRDALTCAQDELRANVTDAEKTLAVYRSVPSGYLQWLMRTTRVLSNVERSLSVKRGGGLRRLSGWRLFPPLKTVNRADASKDTPEEREGADRKSGGYGVHVRTVDALLDAAEAEVSRIGRRRRLLEAARRVLLDASAALPLDNEAVETRHDAIAEEIARLNLAESQGVAPEQSLYYQLRRARGLKDAALVSTIASSISTLSAMRGEADGALAAHGEGRNADALEDALLASVPTVVADAVRGGYALGRQRVAKELEAAKLSGRGDLRRAESYLGKEGLLSTLTMTLGADGFFDVGGSVSPVRVQERELRSRLVDYPSQEMKLETAKRPGDLARAVIDDPRLVLHRLATGRLLTRRYLEESFETRARRTFQLEARLYVLDGSSSMLGVRSRMRDAILVAELASLVSRLQAPESYSNAVVYFRYFDREAKPTERVSSVAQATRAIESVLSTIRSGGTEIEEALVDSFAQVAEARTIDPALSRAQIVLVTDGQAEVDAERVLEARAALGEFPVGVSIITLGEENPSLRQIAAYQRCRGESVFYHRISDASLRRWEATEGEMEWGGLGPAAAAAGSSAAGLAGDGFEAEVDSLLDELEAFGREQDLEAMQHASEFRTVLDEMPALAKLHARFPDAEAARREALNRDVRRLERRGGRWFPDLRDAPVTLAPAPESSEGVALAAVIDVLSVTQEVLILTGTRGLEARADAIEIAERLLMEYGIAPGMYAHAMSAYGDHLRPWVDAVRARF